MRKPRYVKNEEGLYRVRGYISPDQLVEIAASILLENLVDQESLTSPEAAARFLSWPWPRRRRSTSACSSSPTSTR